MWRSVNLTIYLDTVFAKKIEKEFYVSEKKIKVIMSLFVSEPFN